MSQPNEIPVLTWDGVERGKAIVNGNKIIIDYDEERMLELAPGIAQGRITGIMLGFRVQLDIDTPGDIDGT